MSNHDALVSIPKSWRSIGQLKLQGTVWALLRHKARCMALRAAGEKTQVFRDFDPASPNGAEVPDPYYGRPEDFRLMFNLVEAACKGLFEYCVDRYRLEPPSH